MLVQCSLTLSFPQASVSGSDGGTIIPGDGEALPDGTLPLDATTFTCPTNVKGVKQIPIVVPNVTPFCIDATEVSIAEYKVFLADPSGHKAPAPCEGESREPKGNGKYVLSLKEQDSPMRYVDWCDATAYCNWAGKRLCGKPAGGSAAFAGLAQPTESQWFAACTQKNEPYPYGPTHIDGKCNVDQPNENECEVAPSQFPECHGASPELLSMTGNVKEWEDSCDANDRCRLRGASCFNKHEVATCQQAEAHDREGHENDLSDVGFRCCSKP